jgi:hypothetical protein
MITPSNTSCERNHFTNHACYYTILNIQHIQYNDTNVYILFHKYSLGFMQTTSHYPIISSNYPIISSNYSVDLFITPQQPNKSYSMTITMLH